MYNNRSQPVHNWTASGTASAWLRQTEAALLSFSRVMVVLAGWLHRMALPWAPYMTDKSNRQQTLSVQTSDPLAYPVNDWRSCIASFALCRQQLVSTSLLHSCRLEAVSVRGRRRSDGMSLATGRVSCV